MHSLHDSDAITSDFRSTRDMIDNLVKNQAASASSAQISVPILSLRQIGEDETLACDFLEASGIRVELKHCMNIS